MLNKSEYIGVGGLIVVVLAYINNPAQTPKLVASVLSIGASTFVAKKLVNAANKDFGDMIHLTGLALAAVPTIAIIRMAVHQAVPTVTGIGNYWLSIHQIMQTFNNTASWIHNLLPLN